MHLGQFHALFYDSVMARGENGVLTVDPENLGDFGDMLSNWVEQTGTFVEEKADNAALQQASPWATHVTGEAGFAFQMLGEVLTEDLASALRVVLYWGVAGAVHAALTALDPTGRLSEQLTDRLDEQGYIPFTFTLPPESNGTHEAVDA